MDKKDFEPACFQEKRRKHEEADVDWSEYDVLCCWKSLEIKYRGSLQGLVDKDLD